MEMIKEAIEHMWKDHRKLVISAGVIPVSYTHLTLPTPPSV